jgi:hypothetical protein
MKFCPSCGAAVEPTDKFCGGCGFKLADRNAPPPAPPASAAPVPRPPSPVAQPGTADDDDPEKTILISRPRPAAPPPDTNPPRVEPPPPPRSAARPEPLAGHGASSGGGASGGGIPPAFGGSTSSGPAESGSLPDPLADRGGWLAWLLARVKGIVLKPAEEWQRIEPEDTAPAALYKSYVAPLAAIGPIASFIGMVVVGISMPFVGTMRIGVGSGLAMMLTSYVLGLVGVYVIALIANALAPTFRGEQNMQQALKLVAYAYTPAWIAGVLGIIPALGLLTVIAALYSLYLLYAGIPVMMKCPKGNALGYTIVLVIVGIVVGIILSLVTAMFSPTPNFGGSAQVDPASPAGAILGGLAGKDGDAAKGIEAMSQRMEQAGKKLEAAQKSGDPNAAAAAAGEMLGSALAGGRKVDPVDFQQLKAMLPESLSGLPRTSASGEKAAMGPMAISYAEGSYGSGERRIRLKVTDMGGAGLAMSGLAAWAMVEIDKETDSGRERTGKLDGRPFHERYDQRTQSAEFDLVVAQRFLIEANGERTDMASLKSAVSGMDLARLESMKNVGAAN